MPITRPARGPSKALGLALVLVLSACGSTGEREKGKGTSSGGRTTTSKSAYADAGGEAKPAAGVVLKTADFSFHVPTGWTDQTAAAKKLQSMISVASAAPAAAGAFATNVNVVTQKDVYTGSSVSSSDLGKLERVAPTTLKKQAHASVVTALPRVSIDGASALHFAATATNYGNTYKLQQYYAFHDGSEHTVTFSFPVSSTEAQQAAVIWPTLASWSWTG